MATLLFILGALAFLTCLILLYLKKPKKISFSFLILAMVLSLGATQMPNDELAKNTSSPTNEGFGEAKKEFEKAVLEIPRKCQGLVLEQCSQVESEVEKIHFCLFPRFPELSKECQLFLSNMTLEYPALSEDGEVSGILLPKGTVIYDQQGVMRSAILPKEWNFPDIKCGKGEVIFSSWEIQKEDQIKVSKCEKK